MKTRRFDGWRILFWVSLAIYLLMVLFPFYWLVKTSMESPFALAEFPPLLLPDLLEAENVRHALTTIGPWALFVPGLILLVLTWALGRRIPDDDRPAALGLMRGIGWLAAAGGVIWFLWNARLLVNYEEVLVDEGFTRYLLNSFFLATASSILTVSLAILGSYAVARLRFPGKNMFLQTILLIYVLPGVLLIIPLFAMLAAVQDVTPLVFIDSLPGLIPAYLAQTLPVAMYMLSSYFKTVPPEIEEAGLVDGCTRLDVIWRVTIPLSVPAIVTVAIYTFMIAWNEFLYAYVFLRSSDKLTMPIGIQYLFQSAHSTEHLVMAASVITTVPVIGLFLAFEKFIGAGLTAGGVKA